MDSKADIEFVDFQCHHGSFSWTLGCSKFDKEAIYVLLIYDLK